MTIDLYCVGLSQGEDPHILGGCGIVLLFRDEHGRTQRREFAWGLGGSPQELCDFQAVRLALASVAPAFRGAKATVHVESPEVATYLTKGGPDGIIAAMVDARRWYGYYKDIQVMVHAEMGGQLVRARELAKMGMETQKEFDSLTQGAANANSTSGWGLQPNPAPKRR